MNDRDTELLEEILAWTKFAYRDAFVKSLKDVLEDPKHLLAFELSDGKRTQKDIGNEAKISQPTVSLLWTKWRRLGLVLEKSGKAVHLVRPSDLGIEVTGVKEPEPKRDRKQVLEHETSQKQPEGE